MLSVEGGISHNEMFSTFNMGIGMIAVVKKGDVETVLKTDKTAIVIGEIVNGNRKVELIGDIK